MKRTHLSENTEIERIVYPQTGQSPVWPFKPDGLWYDLDGAWLEWCKQSDWYYPYAFDLDVDLSRVFILDNTRALEDFTDRFALKEGEVVTGIDWRKVATEYTGIEVRNYWLLRNAAFVCKDLVGGLWLYGWDVNGGCIWDLAAIQQIKGPFPSTLALPKEIEDPSDSK